MLGPFYVPAPELPLGFDLGRGLKGEPLFVEGTVLSASGAPLANAAVDVWQSDSEGFYDVQLADLQGAQLRGRFRTDSKRPLPFLVDHAQLHTRFRSMAPSARCFGPPPDPLIDPHMCIS